MRYKKNEAIFTTNLQAQNKILALELGFLLEELHIVLDGFMSVSRSEDGKSVLQAIPEKGTCLKSESRKRRQYKKGGFQHSVVFCLVVSVIANGLDVKCRGHF